MTPDALLSIGDLSRATGITTHTLRAWERRYGSPVAERTPSGHRRYAPDTVHRLRRVAELITEGGRPGRLLNLSVAELDGLRRDHDPLPDSVTWAIEAVTELDDASLREILERAADDSSPSELADGFLGPFLAEVGRSWAEGKIEVCHEHMASKVVEDVVRARTTALGEAARDAPAIIVACPTGERHELPLAMLAYCARAYGMRVVHLGADVPSDSITVAAERTDARAVAVTVSLANGGVDSDAQLMALRQQLPKEIELLAGGRGTRGPRSQVKGVRFFADLVEFEQWVRNATESRFESAA